MRLRCGTCGVMLLLEGRRLCRLLLQLCDVVQDDKLGSVVKLVREMQGVGNSEADACL